MGTMFDSYSLDEIVHDLGIIEKYDEVKDLLALYMRGDYQTILSGDGAQGLFDRYTTTPWGAKPGNFRNDSVSSTDIDAVRTLLIGMTAFNAFIQANVTGPPLSARSLLCISETNKQHLSKIRERCLSSLALGGLSVYQHIPHIELFCLARSIFTQYFPRIIGSGIQESRWMRVRINNYHQRLLSSGTSNARLSDSDSELQTSIDDDLKVLEKEVLGAESRYSTEAKVQFVLEKAQIFIMQGAEVRARENVIQAKEVSGFNYALSGALGRRTRFQQTDISQLVVFAKSRESEHGDESKTLPDDNGPVALDLNDDTVLEAIEFTKPSSDTPDHQSDLPVDLKGLLPDKQPQLNPLDQIILLTEATLKDTLSPLDKLNSEEILPYAVRVLSDKPANWQIYTQALLVRSRIEAHRSRTQERSVLQLQAIVDQIIADTQEEAQPSSEGGIPEIKINSFLPKAKPSESAPIMERLKYIYQLNSPTRWEIETELAYAWSESGSLVSALEIFKRLKLWPEVAVCFHSIGQEDKAKQIVRRQLYYSLKGPSMDEYPFDADEVVGDNWEGDMRPVPPHAPRLWCILGDLEQDPEMWERAWKISNNRYARAQRTLGEYYTRKGDLASAREAYIKATVVNRQNDETWSRLGDIDLKVGNWDGAVIAFQQAIMIDDTDSKTYSNLGSALLSKFTEMMELQKLQAAASQGKVEELETETGTAEDEEFSTSSSKVQSPQEILRQALIAFKRGASIAHSNWKIWDNVVTIAARMKPPSFPEIMMGMREVIRIRAPAIGEDAVDADLLGLLIAEVISRERPASAAPDNSKYLAPRGSLAYAVIAFVEQTIIPLVTKRSELYHLASKLSLYEGDYSSALNYNEKAWRIATSGSEWLENVDSWKIAANATDALASALENYGPQEKADGSEVEKGWKGKARSSLRGILGKAKDAWEDTAEYEGLKEKLEELNSS